jgi:two-component system osmolarity sensor histidine kinase EnvZ
MPSRSSVIRPATTVNAGRVPTDVLHADMPKRKGVALSLFWRTFFLLALLLGGGIFAWVQTLRALESEPRVVLAAQQIASMVNLSREGLRYADRINRVALVKAMKTSEEIRVSPREPGDKWEPFEEDRFTRKVGGEIRSRLGPDTIVARSVNGQPGLWVGFSIESDPWWLQAEAQRIHPLTRDTWVVWVGIAVLATIIGSLLIARLINRPLRELSFAASRIRAGEYDSRLDEDTLTGEIREVNMGFNRMARELAKVEEDRAVMLAGISHDLRTPLARLRLEAEMSVTDEEARRNMASDIDQLDAIIDKFMDYARPGETHLRPVHLSKLIDNHLQGRDRPGRDGRRDRARPRLRQPVRERAPLRPHHRDRHRHRHGELRALGPVGHHHRARPRPGRGTGKAAAADDALLPRRRGAHRRHRRRAGPGDRREGDAAHGRLGRGRECARRRPDAAHPPEARSHALRR